MVQTCIVCKKEVMDPLHKDRSFHRFPSNVDLKNKWIHALGLFSVTKSAKICDEHFEDDSFYDNLEYTAKRRLRPNAVPKSYSSKGENISLYVSKNSNASKVLSDTNESVANFSINMDDANRNSNSDNKSPMNDNGINQNTFSNSHVNDVPTNDDGINQNTFSNSHVNDNGAKNNNKRKISCEKYPNKKIRFCSNYGTEWISRKDFVSDESWERFIRFSNYQKRIINSNHQRIFRKGKKIDILQKYKEELLKKQVVEPKYLQDLPLHVQQLIHRMKERKPTIPYPEHLKSFARSLHFHSPSAYRYVRKTFLKCLPCVQTLNSWICSKNYNPGISVEIIEHISNMVRDQLDKQGKN